MDWTALHRRQSAKEQVETFQRLESVVEGYHGVFVANFHNTYMNRETFPTVYGLYESLLETAKAKRYWVATAEACARWWEVRSAARIEPRLDSGKVVCSPSEVDVIVEREGAEPEMIASSPQTVEGPG